MKKMKKSIAFLLATVMLLSAIQVTAFADEIRYDDGGTNGEVSWSYTASTDTLYINGDTIQIMDYGAFPTYKDDELVKDLKFSHLVIGKDVRNILSPQDAGYYTCNDANDYPYVDSKFDITFEEGSILESIGAYTFCGSSATSVTLPDDPALEISIDEGAFWAAESLETFTMYDNVYYLGNNAFSSSSNLKQIRLSSNLTELNADLFVLCTALTDIVIPDGVTKIGSNCFNECSALENVSIPDSVEVIGRYAFYTCTSLRSIVLPKSLNSLYEYVFARCTSLESIDLGNITSINANSLKGCKALKSISFPDGLTSIPASTFKGMSALETVDFNNVKYINNYAFEDCKSLKSVVLPDTVTSLGFNAFNGCTGLTDITISKKLTSIPKYAFSGCNINSPVIPEGITSIGDSAFSSGCSGSISFPSTLTSIGDNAFEHCGLTSIDFGEEGEYLSVGNKAFKSNSNLTSITITPRVVELCNDVFCSCDSLETVNFETRENGDEIDGLYSIGESVFEGTAIKNLVLPESLYEAAGAAFSSMPVLQSIDMSKTHLKTIEEYLFVADTNLTEVVLPEKITSIGQYAFCRTGITHFTFPKSVTEIGDYAFYHSAIEEITVPSTVKAIGEGAFAETKSLRDAKILSKIKNLPDVIFSGCPNLETVKLPTGLTSIGEGAFHACRRLSLESLPDTIVTIGPDAFSESKVDFALPQSLKTLGESAFNSSSIKSAVFIQPDCTIGDSAFSNAFSLTNVVLPANLTEIPKFCFKDTPITGIELPDGLKKIGAYAFQRSSIKSIDFPKSLTSIDKYAFNCCNALTEANLSDTNVTVIDSYSFYECKTLSTITLPDTLTTINDSAFYKCPITSAEILNKNINLYYLKQSRIGFTDYDKKNALTITGYADTAAQTYAKDNGFKFNAIGYYDEFNTEVPNEGTIGTAKWFIDGTELHISGSGAIEKAEFYSPYEDKEVLYTFSHIIEDKGITKLVVEDGITALPDNLFADPKFDQSTLTEVSLPDTLKSIGSYTFADSNIKSIVIPDSVTSIGDFAFYQADLSEGAQLGKGIKTIPFKAFAGTNLTSFTVPANVTEIEEGAFLDCLSLTYIYVPKSVTTICDGSTTQRPIGFTKRGVRLTGLYMEVEDNSEALLYAQTYGINHNIEFDDNWSFGTFGESQFGNTWNYNPETKTMRLNVNSFSSNNNLYYSNGTTLASGELDVELLIVTCGIQIKGSKSTSPFARINPKKISLPNNLEYVSDYAFANITRLTSITIPDSVISISNTAFKNCARLRGINFGNGLKVITSGICQNMTSLEAVEFGRATQSIEYAAFYGCTNLQSVRIPKSVTEIKEMAFANCYGLISIVNDSKANIRQSSFENLPLLEEIVLNSNFTTDEKDFYGVFENYTNKKRNNLVISFTGDITTADLTAYYNANATKYHFGPKVRNVTFRNDSSPIKIDSLTVDNNNPVLYAYGNCLYKKGTDNEGNETHTLILAQNSKGSISAKAGTTAIGENAFFNNEVTSVYLPSSVKTIEQSAFEQCKELKSISIPETLVTIGNMAFKNCTRIKTMNITSAQTIGSNAFEGCANLSSVILPENVEVINDYAFKNCPSLIGIVIPSKIKTISSNIFNGCTSCEEVYIWDTVIKDNNDRFTDCANLTIHTMAGSNAYAYAREYNIPYRAYTDQDVFYDICAIKLDVYAGYLGFCDDGHGDIEYLTVYEANCDYDGYIIGVCEYCSEILEEIHTNATGHSYTIAADIPATETTQGVTKYTCTNCDDTYYTYTPATGTGSQETSVNVNGIVTIATSSRATAGNVPVYSASIIVDGYKVATTDEDGKFSLTLQTGVHEVSIRYSYGIERTFYIVAEDRDINCGSIPIIACDWDKNNVIDEEDIELFKLVISSKPTDPSYLRFVDLNGDGYINAKDMAIIRSCMKYDPAQYNSLIIKAS